MGRSSKPQKVKKGNLRAAAAHYANAAKKNKPGKRRSKKGTTGLSSSARSAAVAAAGEVALLRGVFFGLGDEKWREHVDRVDQPHGRLVYDECLHGGNGGCNEPGYMANCESAWKCERPKHNHLPRSPRVHAPTLRPRGAVVGA